MRSRENFACPREGERASGGHVLACCIIDLGGQDICSTVYHGVWSISTNQEGGS